MRVRLVDWSIKHKAHSVCALFLGSTHRRNVAAQVTEDLKTVTHATPSMEERRTKKSVRLYHETQDIKLIELTK